MWENRARREVADAIRELNASVTDNANRVRIDPATDYERKRHYRRGR